MQITKEKLEQRLAEVTRQKDELLGAANAAAGAAKQLQALIAFCDEPEPIAQPPDPAKEQT